MAPPDRSQFLPSVLSLLIHGMDIAATVSVWGRSRGSGTKRKVLIVRPDAIGDFVLWLDAAQGTRRLYPSEEYRITLLGNRIWTDLAERLPFFDEVIHLDRSRFLRNPAYRSRILREVRRSGFDVVIHPVFSREFLHGDSIVRASGARERIGSTGDCSNQGPFLKRISDRWYTRLVPASKGPLMELERNAEFLRGLGLYEFRCSAPELPGFPPSLGTSNLPGRYVLFPGAGKPEKQWPLEKFARLAERIHHATDWIGIVCGGPGEEDLGESLIRYADAPLENQAGRTSLTELVSIIAGARLLVGNDTSVIHIATAVSTPSVCILGGGHYGRFLPYRTEVETDRPLPVPVVYPMECFHCNWVCIYNPKPGEAAPCILNVSVDAVWDAVRKLLPEAI
jgi:ADP-heptose:LPS heptosyltransferase